MKISSKKEAVKHFTKVKQLEKTGLKAKVSFSTNRPNGNYYAIKIEPELFYVHENGEITSKPPS
jgi:hypothetical protein